MNQSESKDRRSMIQNVTAHDVYKLYFIDRHTFQLLFSIIIYFQLLNFDNLTI